jgi:hypothetical protein
MDENPYVPPQVKSADPAPHLPPYRKEELLKGWFAVGWGLAIAALGLWQNAGNEVLLGTILFGLMIVAGTTIFITGVLTLLRSRVQPPPTTTES